MISKTFVFSKIQKTPSLIESSLNDWLKDHSFKFATQNESHLKGKFIVSLFAEEKPGTIRAKVFKDQHVEELDKRVNEFLQSVKMKFVSQTFVGSNVYSIIFFDASKLDNSDQQ